MRFIVKVGNEIVGFSELESGDPPMGVAFGRFVPTAAYKSIQQHCMADAWQPIPTLTVEFEEGQPLERSGPVQIIDCGPEFGEKGIQVFVNGIPYPLYGELFPQHVERYRKQFE
jgi:hypothetical protein